MALTLMPYNLLDDFDTLKMWLTSNIIELDPIFSTSARNVIYQFIPGPKPFKRLEVILLIRKNKNCNVFYGIFILAFHNIMLQVILPSPEKDIYFDEMLYQPFPAIDSSPYGSPEMAFLDLSAIGKISKENFLKISYESCSEVDPADYEDILKK